MASSWIIWLLALFGSVGAAVLGVLSGRPDVLGLIMSVICVLVACVAIAENWHVTSSGASKTTVAAINARHMGFVWSLGALSLFLTYAFLLEWKEWLVFTGVFITIAFVCLAFSVIVEHNGGSSDSATGDDALLMLARYLTIVQLVGMIVTMGGLALDGKIPASTQANPGWYDWAGNVIFFYGALSLAAISANALYTERRTP